MRGLRRASVPVCSVWLAAGCNALFGVEEPIAVDEATDGGSGGEAAKPASGGAGGDAGRPPGGDGGSNRPPEPQGGEAGASEFPGADGIGGAGGERPHTPAQGGEPSNTGGGAVAGGSVGAGGEPSETGGAQGAAGAPDAAGAAGAPACVEGSARCISQTVLEVCDDGAVELEDCGANGCLVDHCADCVPETAQCSQGGRRARLCDENGQLGPELTCTNQTCDPDEGCRGECEPGQVRCNPDDGDAEACNAGDWQQVDECVAQVDLCVVENSISKCIDNPLWPLGPNQPLTSGQLYNRTPNVLHVFKLPRSTEDALASHAGLIGNGTAALARIFVYEDDGTGYPGTLVARTDRVDVDGEGIKRGALLPSGSLISASKDYWVGVVFGSPGTPQLVCRDGDANAPASYAVAQSYDASPPDQFPTDSLENAEFECNLFLEVRTRTP